MKNKKTLRLVILFFVLCLTLGTFIVYDNFKIDVTEYAIESVDLPKNFDGFKIRSRRKAQFFRSVSQKLFRCRFHF